MDEGQVRDEREDRLVPLDMVCLVRACVSALVNSLRESATEIKYGLM